MRRTTREQKDADIAIEAPKMGQWLEDFEMTSQLFRMPSPWIFEDFG